MRSVRSRMKNKFNRCCCPGEVIETFSLDLTGQASFDYIIGGRTQILLGVEATVNGIATGLWSGQGAFFGRGNATIPRGATIQSASFSFANSLTK